MVEDGLSSSRVRGIYQDMNGFIWVTGENGLDRFTGEYIQNFTHSDENEMSILNNEVTAVFMDKNRKIWIGSGKGLNKLTIDKNKFEHILMSDLETPNRGFSISSIVSIPNPDRIIVGTGGHGIHVIDINTHKVDVDLSTRLTRLAGINFIGDMVIDKEGLLWVVTNDKGFRIIDLKKMKLIKPEYDPSIISYFPNLMIRAIKQDNLSDNVLIATSSRGLFVYDRKLNLIKRAVDTNTENMNIQSVLIKKDGTILLGAENRGIWIVERGTWASRKFTAPYNTNVDLEHSKVHALLEDNNGNLWVGLYQKGIFIIPKATSGFEYFAVSENSDGKNRACVTDFVKDKQGNIWISTDGGGLFRASGNNLNKLQIKENGLTCHSMMTLEVDNNGTVWTGSYGHGLFCAYNNEVFDKPEPLSKVADDKIMCLKYDKKRNNLYIGTNGNRVDVINLSTNQLKHITAPINKWVRAIHVDKFGKLWLGTPEGTFYYDIDKNRILEANIGISRYSSTFCFEEYGNFLFIGTLAGLVKYDLSNNTSIQLNQGKDIELQNILAMIVGDDQSLWFTTPRSLSRLNLKTNYIRTYSSFEGFNIGEFRFGSVMKDENGKIMFGGDNGIIRIDPSIVNKEQHRMRPIYITGLNINNKPVDYDFKQKSANVLDASLVEAKKIRLSYKENSLTLHFSALEYSSPLKVNYSYRLNGYDNTWHYTNASNAQATYVGLPPGRYTFEVKGFFDEESKNITTKSIRVIIANPWYSSIVARIVFFLLIVGLVYFLFRYYKSRQQQRRELEMAQYNEKVKEDKLRLFTNIAHEIRTPLTLIISPLRKLLGADTDNDSREMHSLMYRNSMKILQTINQLLDIRKLDNGQLKLHFSEMNLISIIKNVMLSFKNVATIKQISFSLETSETEDINIWLDSNHFDKIIYNILSNAFKFTPGSGKILIRITSKDNDGIIDNERISKYAEIKIFNTGNPIDEYDLNHIFERFYQSEKASGSEGSGIGLHLTYELVLLHYGQIEARNIGEEGVEFTVRIPLGNSHLTEEEMIPHKSESDVKSPIFDKNFEITTEKDFVDTISIVQESEDIEHKNKYNILVVDDNEDFCQYIKKELTDYTISTCNSGNKAWKQILSNHPDLVVTDYLMPDGNGLELCQKIKSNTETDSIPVIILTAENSESVEIQSIELHADRFLTKPFNIQILNGAISQALRVREKIKKKVQRTEMGYNYESMVIDSADDKLVKKVIDYIKANLEDCEMSVETLSREVGLSRVHLNRKLKEILGISPSNLIKSIRLKQAAYLLVNNKVNISEVAYKVGFSSHSYFSFNFHEFFGMSPKEFIIYYTENQDEESIRKLLE